MIKEIALLMMVVGFCQIVQGAFASTTITQHTQQKLHISRLPTALLLSGGATSAAEASHHPPNAAETSNSDTSTGATTPSGAALALPTLKQYKNFALPCLGLWIAGPLLSLVDTSFVGLSGDSATSARLLAALGPATTFFDGATYLFAFLNVATTNLYSTARAQHFLQAGIDDDGSGGGEKAESVVRTAAQVSVNCGIGLMIFLILACRPLLALYIGDKAAATPGLLDAAVDYVCIRAFSLPTSLLLGVVQASLLGAKDSVTPLIAILYSTVVNVIGDYVLCNVMGWGLQGAALATTAAQWAGTAALMRPAKKRLLQINTSWGLWQKKTKNNAATTDDEANVTSKVFLSFAAPVLTLIVGKLAAFGFMTHAAAAVPGQPTPLAAHQILLSLLFFSSPFFEVISQTAQTFLPPYLQSASRGGSPAAAQAVATQLMGLGLSVAGVVATAAWVIPSFLSSILTSNAEVQAACRPLAKWLWMGAFFWAPVAVSEGVLLARRELRFLAGVYLISTLLLPPALLQVKSRKGTVGQIWACFAVFQLFRSLCFTLRIWGAPVVAKLFGKRNPKDAEKRLEQDIHEKYDPKKGI